MSEKIKFSVLVPVFNVESFITECIDSVLHQTYQNFELILIDDGSTDSSGKICDEYEKNDNRIKVYHQGNEGHIMARRKAISKVSGDFCLFLDSDDYWDYDLLAYVYQTISKHDCDMVLFKYKRVSENGDILSESKAVFKDNMVFDESNKEEIFKILISSSILNNLIIKAVKFSIIEDADYSQYKNIKNAEDLLESLAILYNAQKIIYIDKAIYNYRMVSSSITHTFNINLVKDVTIVRSTLLQYMKKLRIDNEENLRLFYDFYMHLIVEYIVGLSHSDITNKEKKDILHSIKNLHLYMDALNHIDVSTFSLRQKIVFHLFSKNYYKMLFACGSTMRLISRITKGFKVRKCN